MQAAALVIGEALVDVTERGGQLSIYPGGSPLNVAVGLARLGITTTLHSAFGADDNGRLISDHLAASGVRLAPATVTGAPTSVARATIAADGSASYDFAITWEPAPIDTTGFAMVHTGSIGAALDPGVDIVQEALTGLRNRALVSYDPNVRPALMGDHARAVRRVERFVTLSHVVKASDEDIEWLYPGVPIPEVFGRWLDLGAALVLATRGSRGAMSATAAATAEVAAPSITVADTIGAGDSFMAGLLAALVDHSVARDDLPDLSAEAQTDLLEFAARCAAITTSRVGANPPTRAELTSQ